MSKAYISLALRAEAESYFQGRCAYCSSPQALMNVTFEIDHILPEAVGGLTIRDNLAFACPLCNTYKGARTHGRDPQSGQTLRLFHPRVQIWSRHFRWAQDQQTLEGRTQAGRATIDAMQLNNSNLLRLRVIWLTIGSSPPDWHTPPLINF